MGVRVYFELIHQKRKATSAVTRLVQYQISTREIQTRLGTNILFKRNTRIKNFWNLFLLCMLGQVGTVGYMEIGVNGKKYY